MNPFENINLPQNDENSPSCWSEVVNSINRYFDQEWASLNKQEIAWVMNSLSNEIESCKSAAHEEFRALNKDMYSTWITINNDSVWEDRFLSDLWLTKPTLEEFLWKVPDTYTLRTTWNTVIVSNSEWKPIAEFDQVTQEIWKPGLFTMREDIADNINGTDYVFAEALIEREEDKDANALLEWFLWESPIFIDGLQEPETLRLTAEMYQIWEKQLKTALGDFIQRSSFNTENNFYFKKHIWGGFQISSKSTDWKTYLSNYQDNWEFDFDLTY